LSLLNAVRSVTVTATESVRLIFLLSSSYTLSFAHVR
jgi:hypothetical protein